MKLLDEDKMREEVRKAWNQGYKVAQQTYASGGVAEAPEAMRDDIDRELYVEEVMKRV